MGIRSRCDPIGGDVILLLLSRLGSAQQQTRSADRTSTMNATMTASVSLLVPAGIRARANPAARSPAATGPVAMATGSRQMGSPIALRTRPAAGLRVGSHPAALKPAGSRARCVETRASASSAAAPTPAGASKPAGDDKVGFFAFLRAQCFYLFTFILALPLFASMVVMFPFVYFTDKYRRNALSFVNDVWATVSTSLFTPIEVIGRENLPSVETPAVYVANHASYLDIYSLFHLRRPFKFISKVSNFIIPIIGWSMYLTGHIALKRTDRKSQMKTLKDCRMLLQNDCSVLFFPEGTRSVDGTMADFKKGAFSVAAKENALVVPVTLVNCSKVMKNGREWAMRSVPGGIKVVVHPPIQSTDAQELCDKSYNTIKETLVQYS
jgi:1-acyl-sn-glycerol-3-phosphate acyltransferase